MEWILQLRYALWGPFTVLFLLLTGVYLTLKTRAVQLWAPFLLLRARRSTQTADTISPWQALCTSLGGTLGVGNLAGVSLAIALGGPGAVFYMLLAAFFGMATKYAELLLSVRCRIRQNGMPLGGPMVYLARRAGLPRIGKLFALCCVISALGTGAAAQGSAITEAVHTVLPLPPLAIGIAVALLLLPVLRGGGKRIARVSAVLVPVMTLLYLSAGALVLIAHADQLPGAFGRILQGALDPLAAGGGFVGLISAHTVADGISKGIFSNEAGMGSAPIAHGCANVDDPCQEGLLGTVEVFLDTFVVCLMTALVLLVTGADQSGYIGLTGTIYAFSGLFGRFAGVFIAITVVFLAASTVLGWSFYGMACLRFLHARPLLQQLYPYAAALCIVLAAFFPLNLLLQLSDIAAACMTLPNLLGLWVLAPVVSQETDRFLQRARKKK